MFGTGGWRDNKIFFLSSIFIGEVLKLPVKRHVKVNKNYIELSCIVAQYSVHTRGVDPIDFIMGRYKIQLCHKRSINLQTKKFNEPAQYAPLKVVRKDKFGHWPMWVKRRIRCKMCNCQGVSQNVCKKCGVALCYNKRNNCFRSYYNKSVIKFYKFSVNVTFCNMLFFFLNSSINIFKKHLAR